MILMPTLGKYKLTAAIAVGLAIRLMCWFWSFQSNTLHDDERDYNRLAQMIVMHGEFAFDPGRPVSLRPPLYPAIVAAIYSIVGVDNYQAVRLVQIAISLATVLIVYYLGCEVYSERVGLSAAWILAVYPSLAAYTNLILTETLFTFFLTGFCLAITKAMRLREWRFVALAGVLLGLGALTRSVLWMFPPILAVFLLACWPGELWRRGMAVGIVLLAFAVVIAPWTIRNTRLQKTFTAVDCMGGRNFMMGNYQHTPLFGSWATIGLQGTQAWHYEVLQENPHPAGGWTQGQIDKLALKQGLKFVAANPLLTVQRDVVKFLDFWGVERELISGALHGYFGEIPKPIIALGAALIVGAYFFVILLGVYGATIVRTAQVGSYCLILLMIVYVTGIHSLVFGHSRYHLPLIPLVAIFAAAAVMNQAEIVKAYLARSFLIATCLCAALVTGWCALFVCEDLGRLQRLLGQLSGGANGLSRSVCEFQLRSSYNEIGRGS